MDDQVLVMVRISTGMAVVGFLILIALEVLWNWIKDYVNPQLLLHKAASVLAYAGIAMLAFSVVTLALLVVFK